ncbi:MAG: 23S rRNA (adenine(2503)-C(2))-methyltransferase RlmN [Litorilinea sp.]
MAQIALIDNSADEQAAGLNPAAEGQDERISLLDLSQEELTAFMQELGQPAYRARQMWEWIYRRYALDFDAMANLPKALRTALSARARINPLTPIAEVVSAAQDTLKVLFRLHDGQTIEAVLMVYDTRRTLCISSQAGCAMGCTFCATAQGGLARNLTAGEIVAQVLYFARYLAHTPGDSTNDTLGDTPGKAADGPLMDVERPTHVTNVVLMGMGEPMHNYHNVWTALRRLNAPEGFGLGARHITLSTVGLVPMIDRMAEEGLQVGLAVSLHAPNDELRDRLTPINTRYPIDELLAAVERYIERTNRRVTFEYALMRGINDSPELAEELAQKLRRLLCHVNLIPLNPIPDSPFQPTSDADTLAFAEILRSYGISTTVRVRRGIEIAAGCGQLRRAVAA